MTIGTLNNNRRRFERTRLGLSVQTRVSSGESTVFGRVESVSAGGVRLWSSKAEEPGNRIELTMEAPLVVGEPVKAIAEVVRCQPQGDGYALGCRFHSMEL